MDAFEVLEALRVNYFAASGFDVRAPARSDKPVAQIIVLVTVGERRTRLFGLRLLDYPLSPPTLRFWRPERWDQEFDFDFTSNGDAGSGTTTTPQGVPTMCIPHHVDYYRAGWHTDRPWMPAEADAHVADLVSNILRRSR